MLANSLCSAGTEIVSLGTMYFDKREWSHYSFSYSIGENDLSWMGHVKETEIHLYKKIVTFYLILLVVIIIFIVVIIIFIVIVIVILILMWYYFYFEA